MSIITNPTQKSSERAFTLQKYLLLHSQHDALQKHLDHITPSLPTEAPSSSPFTPNQSRHSSVSSSPGSDESTYLSSPPQAIRHHHRSGSTPTTQPIERRNRRHSLPAVVDESVKEEIQEDETKLKHVNQQIKSTLTELLNCESVRSDRQYRMWVQTRLMDAEKELKGSRSRSCERRRSEDVSAMI